MTVLVTGATGFLGGHLVDRLAGRGEAVRVLARRPEAPAAARLKDLGVEVLAGDVRDAAAVQRAVAGCRLVHHVAAARSGSSRADLRSTNVEGTRALVRAATAAGVERLVYVSSSGVHGRPREVPVTEDSPCRPNSPYRRSKLAAEEVVREETGRSGLPFAIARPTATFGPRDHQYPEMFRSVLAGRFRAAGDGEVRYHMSWVGDVVEGIRLCGEPQAGTEDVFIVGSEEVLTLRGFAELIAAAGGQPLRVRRIPAAPVRAAAALVRHTVEPLGLAHNLSYRLEMATRSRFYSVARARDVLGLRQELPLAEGVARTVQAYRRAGLLG